MTTLTPELKSIQRRLDRWELGHLRTLAADQAQRLEESEAREADLQRRLDDAEDRARFWHDQAIDAFNDAAADGAVIGLEIDGSISVMRPTTHQ